MGAKPWQQYFKTAASQPGDDRGRQRKQAIGTTPLQFI
jgi:hypothetical protein